MHGAQHRNRQSGPAAAGRILGLVEDEWSSAAPGHGAPPEPWNHNVRYHQVILDAIPPGCAQALDVGCGTGALTRRLRRFVSHVTGVDRDERCIELARAHPGAGGIDYLPADFLASSFEPGSLDLITSVASLHHMDAEAALVRMRDLLRPGGVLAVIGLARGISPAGIGLAVPAIAGNQLHRAASARDRRGAAGRAAAYQAPVTWPPPLTYRDTRRLASRVLPGARYRRRLYWRYSLVWAKPTSPR
jgi:SAM-dependent methyltransferase